jgi:hypothetical protein
LQIVCQDEITKIGINKFSETFLPEIYDIGLGFVLGDCPGAKDNRHPIINIANAINMIKLIQSVESISILIVISYHAISFKGSMLNDLINMFSSIFGDLE